jgi:two-component system response regulator
VSSSALNWRRLLTIVGRRHIAADNSFESFVTSIDRLLTHENVRIRTGGGGGQMPTARIRRSTPRHVRDGADALDYLYRRGTLAYRSDGQPAMILLDLKLPKVDGLEVLRQIKGDSALKMIPVVMMTSSRVNAYVVKPMKLQDFVEAVRQVGAFWGVINEVPPGSVRRIASTGS